MPTKNQLLGNFGELLVVRNCSCARCKRKQTLHRLPSGFKCADVICDFCGFLAQVKSCTATDVTELPNQILGAAWGPQKARMDAGIYFPLYVVLATLDQKKYGIYYLSADVQSPEIFVKRAPLSEAARRAGWQGFNYNLKGVKQLFAALAVKS